MFFRNILFLLIVIIIYSFTNIDKLNTNLIVIVKGGDDVIKNARVYLKNSEGEIVKEIATNDKGKAIFVNLQEGKYLLQVIASEWKTYGNDITIIEGDNSKIVKLKKIKQPSIQDDNKKPKNR